MTTVLHPQKWILLILILLLKPSSPTSQQQQLYGLGSKDLQNLQQLLYALLNHTSFSCCLLLSVLHHSGCSSMSTHATSCTSWKTVCTVFSLHHIQRIIQHGDTDKSIRHKPGAAQQHMDQCNSETSNKQPAFTGFCKLHPKLDLCSKFRDNLWEMLLLWLHLNFTLDLFKILSSSSSS